MRYYADLHIHSRFSRATSPECDLEHLHYWALKKGITVLGTGDFTHPAWMGELRAKLLPSEPGLFKLRKGVADALAARLPVSCRGTVRFMLSGEISTIYKSGDKTRKVHHLVYAPTIQKAQRISRALGRIGNIATDGRPILRLGSRDLLEIVLEAGGGCYLVPAHIWTPWFSVLGSRSGFDAIAECYRDLAQEIFAVETGLSSDPEMNRRVKDLDRFRLVSNSDAHSPAKIGREASLFETDLDYFSMRHALRTGKGFGGTVEFFPEEGKYHLDGHRKCGVRLTPEESRAADNTCPVCDRPLTLGVLHRLRVLATRKAARSNSDSTRFSSLIPLREILSEILGIGPQSKRVAQVYEETLASSGPELQILDQLPLGEIQSVPASLVREAISRMRGGRVMRDPGFDGEYGRIKLFGAHELSAQKPIAP